MPYPVVILPGFFAGARPYQEMEAELRSRGFDVTTVPLTPQSWFPTLGGRPMTPILQQLEQTVQQVLQQSHRDAVNLVGHSAGGWIARIYLGEKPYLKPDQVWDRRHVVKSLITLGTPHISQERWTRRNIDFVNAMYPGAFYSDIKYTCVAGKAIFGQRRLGTWFAYNSYALTCGDGNVWGDGITPITAAHLAGANNIVLEQVQHSPKPGATWYGTEQAIAQWSKYLS